LTSEVNNHLAGPFEIVLSVQDWTLIDATMDNTVANADQNGDESTAEQGRIVQRQAGQRQGTTSRPTRGGKTGRP
jgi:hypothetical protein